ncbi:hypothetical protein [Streptomyces sp. NPDC057052]
MASTAARSPRAHAWPWTSWLALAASKSVREVSSQWCGWLRR